MHVNVLVPFLIIALVFTSGCISGHEKTPTFSVTPIACPNRENVTALNSADNITANSSTYKLAVELMRTELERAKEIYREVVKENKQKSTGVGRPLSNFTRTFLTDSAVINDTAIRIGNETYTFVLIRLRDRSCGVRFEPNVTTVNGISVRLLPPDYINGTRTYTGLPYSRYSVRVEVSPQGERACTVRFNYLSTLWVPSADVGNLVLIAQGGMEGCGEACENIGDVSFGFLNVGSEDVTVYLILVKEG
jgi:hypothetical protein